MSPEKTRLENVTNDAIFDHFPLSDETLRHIERHQSLIAKSANTYN